MTKKHFIAIAAEFKASLIEARARTEAPEQTANGIFLAINAFCRVAIADNPRFDTKRFLTACGC